MSRRTGYVFWDEKYSVYRGRITYTDSTTHRLRERWVSGKTSEEAWSKLDEVNKEIAEGKVSSGKGKRKLFSHLAAEFADLRIIPAVFDTNGHKIAGYKDPSIPQSYMTALLDFFGLVPLKELKPRHIEQFKLKRLQTPTYHDKKLGRQCTRKIASVNREIEFLRVVLNYGSENDWPIKNPFEKKSARRLIERSRENKRERIPTFAEEMSILSVCVGDRSHLRDVLIIGADTGMRRGEIIQLSWQKQDVDLIARKIRLRPETTKTGRARVIPMTDRVFEVLSRRYKESHLPFNKAANTGLKSFEADRSLVFNGLKEFKRSFGTACRMVNVEGLRFHDYSRHAFITRSILAGIPPAVVVMASGHSSDEWQRYLNVGVDNLHALWEPRQNFSEQDVRKYGDSILKQLAQALGFKWEQGRAVL